MGSSLTFETKAPALNRNTLSCGGDLSWIKNVLLTVMVVTHQGFTSCLLPGNGSVALCILIYLMPETICGMCAVTVTDEEIQIT